jgi:hypothetical protein
MKNGVFWVVTPCGSCKNRRFGGTSALTRATRRNKPEDTILHSHRRENLKSYIEKTKYTSVSHRQNARESQDIRIGNRKMFSSGILLRVAVVRPVISEELSASFIRVTRIGELGITLAVTSNRHTLRRITPPQRVSVANYS